MLRLKLLNSDVYLYYSLFWETGCYTQYHHVCTQQLYDLSCRNENTVSPPQDKHYSCGPSHHKYSRQSQQEHLS